MHGPDRSSVQSTIAKAICRTVPTAARQVAERAPRNRQAWQLVKLPGHIDYGILIASGLLGCLIAALFSYQSRQSEKKTRKGIYLNARPDSIHEAPPSHET